MIGHCAACSTMFDTTTEDAGDPNCLCPVCYSKRQVLAKGAQSYAQGVADERARCVALIEGLLRGNAYEHGYDDGADVCDEILRRIREEKQT